MNMRNLFFFILGAITLILSGGVSASPYYFSIEVEEHVNPFDYYPLHDGNIWVYQHSEKKDIGGGTKFLTKTWESRETVLAHHDFPDGMGIVVEITNSNISYEYSKDIQQVTEERILKEIETLKKGERKYYWIRGNYICELYNREWLEQKTILPEEIRKTATTELCSPEFFFPMELVNAWSPSPEQEQEDYLKGELWKQGKSDPPDPSRGYWHVMELADVDVPFGRIQQTRSLVYFENTESIRRWFKSGIGVVKEKYKHNGSYHQYEKVLKTYTPYNK